MIEEKLLYEIDQIKKYLNDKDKIGEFHNDGLGFYSYDDQIINFISSITDSDKYKKISNIIGRSKTTAVALLNRLIEKELIIWTGTTKNDAYGKYIIKQ